MAFKIKTRKAVAKRFQLKPSGKVKRSRANKRHILTKKSRARKNKLKKPAYVHHSNLSRVLPNLPYG